MIKTRTSVLGLILTMVTLAACERGPATDAPQARQTPEEAMQFMVEAAKQERAAFRDMTFEDFKAQVYKEPFEGGKYIVNGDTPILGDKQLREFFEQRVQQEPATPTKELIVHREGGLDATWNDQTKLQLTYCVSDAFGARHADVVAQMTAAGDAWEASADLDFIHNPDQDASCSASNANVVFDVRPVNVAGRYLARAFFPNEPRSARNVLIDNSSFSLGSGNLTLVGILRHELGHTLGFRHEHTRPSSGACFEDQDWRTVTSYDAFSVMHYPQCNGRGDWSLTLTERDRHGAACVYGAAAGFSIDTGVCTPERVGEVPPGQPRTVEHEDQTVAEDQERQYGPFAVAPGSPFTATLTGSGDPDLYVRFGAEPLLLRWDCRPYLWGAEETCSFDVPPGATLAFVMVHGYAAGEFDLTVTHTPGGP